MFSRSSISGALLPLVLCILVAFGAAWMSTGHSSPEKSPLKYTAGPDVDQQRVFLGEDPLPWGGGQTAIRHRVRRGETLSQIADEYGVGAAALAEANHISDPNRIRAGQVLIIPAESVVHRVVRGDSVWKLGRIYGVSVNSIAKANNLTDPARIRSGQCLIIPIGEPVTAGPQGVASSTSLSLNWPLPVRGRISSRFGPRWGKFHTGVDIAVPSGTAILAAAPGKVTYAAALGAYGRLIIVEHENGSQTWYAHASRILVQRGQHVAIGEKLGLVGSSGHSTGSHLHFEVRLRGEPHDPLNYIGR